MKMPLNIFENLPCHVSGGGGFLCWIHSIPAALQEPFISDKIPVLSTTIYTTVISNYRTPPD